MQSSTISFFVVVFLVCCISACQPTQKVKSNDDILGFIEFHQIDSVRTYLSADSVNVLCSNAMSLLSMAIINEHLPTVEYVLSLGADVDLKNQNQPGSTPLMECSSKDIAFAQMILDHTPDIDLQDNFGDPAINWAAFYGNLDLIRLLIDKGAKTDQPSFHATHALIVAMKEWQFEAVDLFIERGHGIVDVDSSDLPLIQTIRSSDPNRFTEIFQKDKRELKDGSGTSLLGLAARMGQLEIVQQLLDAGANVNAVNPAGHSPLTLAARFNQLEVMDLLIQNDAGINLSNDRYRITPLMATAAGGHVEAGQKLLEKGAYINITDGINGFSPLIIATLGEQTDYIKMLLEYQPNLNIVSNYGFRAVDVAYGEIKDLITPTSD
ncbi:MAG: ankyrin repeat domain-containing protein [Bacteroidota bacterium]